MAGTLEKFMNDCIACVKPYNLLEECEEKEAAEILCYELTTIPHSFPTRATQMGVGREIRRKVEHGEYEGVGERCF